MICRDCPAKRRVKRNDHNCVMCMVYGMILKEDHVCDREGWQGYERIDNQGDEIDEAAELPEDGGGAAGGGEGVLSESGERESFPGMAE